LSSQTTEYYRFPVLLTVSGQAVDPTPAAISFALVETGDEPESAEWVAGAWETDTSTDPDTYYARILFGTGGITLADGEYDLFVRFALAPENVIRKIARVVVQ
jgi:hypothetical protein